MALRHGAPRYALAVVIGLSLFGSGLIDASSAAADAKSTLPAPIKGWKQIGATKLYNSTNIFDLIDGEGQSVLNYAFSACAHAEYAPTTSAKPVLTIDVFDMTDPQDAYGLFGSDRRSGKAVSIGAEGVRIEPSGLDFWKGRYVIRTTVVQVSPANRTAQEAFARAAAAKISGASGPPAIISLLPPGYEPGTQSYMRADVAGQSYLKNGVIARYPAAGQQAELFIVNLPSPAEAKQAYTHFQTDSTKPSAMAMGAKPMPLKGLGDTAFEVKSRFQGEIVAAQKGKYVIAVRKAKDATKAEAVVKAALARAR